MLRAKLLDLAAQVVVLQAYHNDSTVPIEAKYVFPLDDMAAVCGFEAFMVVMLCMRVIGKSGCIRQGIAPKLEDRFSSIIYHSTHREIALDNDVNTPRCIGENTRNCLISIVMLCIAPSEKVVVFVKVLRQN